MERTTTFQGETSDTFVSITSAPDTREDATEQQHMDFLLANWTAIAAASHEGYQRHGVGVVVIPPRLVTTPDVPPNIYLAQRMLYGTPGGAWMKPLTRTSPIQWIDKVTDTYNPTDEVLVVILATGSPRAYRVRASLSPPDAFDRLRATLN
jgi:hypothetical protein